MKAHANATGCCWLRRWGWALGLTLIWSCGPALVVGQAPPPVLELPLLDQNADTLPPLAPRQAPPAPAVGARTPPLRAPAPGNAPAPGARPHVIPVIPPQRPSAQRAPVPRAPAQRAQPAAPRPIQPVSSSGPSVLPDVPSADPQRPSAPPNSALPANALPSNAVPISLDAVLRLAQDQNGAVRLAREKLQEAYIEHELAGKRWIPDLTVGLGYWRHEGGIQDFDGRLLDSSYGSMLGGLELRGKIDLRDAVYTRLETERKIWHQKGELSRFTTDQLLDAASTYVDLLTARSTEAIALEAEKKLQDLLVQAQKLAKIDPGVQVEVARVESELGAQQILTRRLREGVRAAAAKLSYLLDLNPRSELVVTERQLVAFRLVESPDTEALVELALKNGPGIRELSAILCILEEARQKQLSSLHLLPTLEVRMVEGAFGAGPGSRMDWENRWDLGIQARWNLTEFLGSSQRKRLADLRIEQAHLGYQDLRGKLRLGVREACEAYRSGQEQAALAARQIQHAEDALRLSDMRLRENIKGRTPSEVLLAIRALVGARVSYLHAIRDLDKAQLRLFVLTGGVTP